MKHKITVTILSKSDPYSVISKIKTLSETDIEDLSWVAYPVKKEFKLKNILDDIAMGHNFPYKGDDESR